MKRLIFLTFVIFSLSGLAANPADKLLERLQPGLSKKFKTELVKSDTDFFELDQAGKKIVVRGNSWLNIASGINWYLKHKAGVHVSWNNLNPVIPEVLPAVTEKERHQMDLSKRYNFNYCTFSYSMPFWDWERWEKEIDWMALHGINMPLAATGLECVWKNMLTRLGYDKDEINAFVSGPAFTAWWAMNNLEGWGGPNPDSWYDRQERLQKKILARERELGMEPVLPGYVGMVPHDANAKLGLNTEDAGRWNSYIRPANLSPSDPRFNEIASVYYDEMTKLYGKAKYYSMDPFHESGHNSSIDYASCGKKIMETMKQANPEAVWVIQGWGANPEPALTAALKKGDLLVLDLFGEARDLDNPGAEGARQNRLRGHDWVLCLLQNFGGNTGLHGRIDQLLRNFDYAVNTSDGIKPSGFGFAPEGIENNPMMFELMSELPWLTGRIPSKGEWLRMYAKARYGVDDPAIAQAWEILGNSIYNCPSGSNQQSTHESIFCSRPGRNVKSASTWAFMHNYYDPAATLEAARLFNSVAGKYKGNSNFEYDLVDITRQALADQGRRQYLETMAAYNSFSRDEFRKKADRFLEMLMLQDELTGTMPGFMVGPWIETARNSGTTDEEKDLYEWNARVQITTWGNRDCSEGGHLHDYANKEWNGLLADFHYPRWERFFNEMEKGLKRMDNGREPEVDWYGLEEKWTLDRKSYPTEPQGDPVEVSRKVIRELL